MSKDLENLQTVLDFVNAELEPSNWIETLTTTLDLTPEEVDYLDDPINWLTSSIYTKEEEEEKSEESYLPIQSVTIYPRTEVEKFTKPDTLEEFYPNEPKPVVYKNQPVTLPKAVQTLMRWIFDQLLGRNYKQVAESVQKRFFIGQFDYWKGTFGFKPGRELLVVDNLLWYYLGRGLLKFDSWKDKLAKCPAEKAKIVKGEGFFSNPEECGKFFLKKQERSLYCDDCRKRMNQREGRIRRSVTEKP